eukprot:PITA_05905
MLSCRLEFECTNNTAEYEALVQGLYKAISLKVQYLKVFGDSEIIVKQSYDNQIIEEDEHDSQIKEITQENAIPKPVVKLEDLYDIKDRFRPVTNTKIQSSTLRILAGASNIPESSDTGPTEEINQVSVTDSESQYVDLIFYLKNGHAPPHLSYKSKRAIRLKEKTFTIIDNVLFKKNYDSILLRCLEKIESQKVLQELHDGPAGGNFGADTTAHKIIHAGYYWPTLFRNTHEYVRKYLNCQTASGRQRKSAFPLQPVNIEQPFDQLGLDIIGEINPPSSK